GDWNDFRTLARLGHSIQSHNFSHYTSETMPNDSLLKVQYSLARKMIRDSIPGDSCYTIAYPDGDGKPSIAQDYYIGARGVYGMPNQANQTWYLYANAGSLTESRIDYILNPETDEPWYWRGWIAPVFHYHKGDSTIMKLDLLKSHENEIWVGLFEEIVKYGQERDTHILTPIKNNNHDSIVFSVADSMRDNIYDYPLTVKVCLGDSWTDSVLAFQNGAAVAAETFVREGITYCLVKAIPDRGNVLITRGTIPPATPILAAPASGTIDVALSPALSWNTAVGAVTYQLQVATDSLFAAPALVVDTNLTALANTIGPLTAHTTYFWRVRAMSARDSSAWSTIWNFVTIIAPPAKPTLVSPTAGAQNTPVTTPLTWNAVETAVSYQVQVGRDSLFGSLVVDTTIATLTLSVGPLKNDSTYYWHVRATNAGGTGEWSDRWNFITIALPPVQPVLVSPTNNAQEIPLTTQLTWNGAGGATSYQVQMAADSLFATLLVDSTVTAPSCAIGSLTANTTYYWHVRAKNAGGQSEWTGRWSFMTIVTPPVKPVLALPANGSQGVAASLQLKWNEVPAAKSYHCQVAVDSLFASCAVNDSTLTTTIRDVGPLNLGTLHFWRIRAKNSSGFGEWSETWRFATIVPLPEKPTLVSPENATSISLVSIPLKWTAVSAATSYYVQLATDSLFTTLIAVDSTLTTLTKEVGPLAANTTYFWRVKACNSAGASPWSLAWSFTIVTTGLNDAQKGKPAIESFEFNVNPACVVLTDAQVSFYYKSKRKANVKLVVFDALGSIVFERSTMVPPAQSMTRLCSWDMTRGAGRKVGNGMYLGIVRVTDESGAVSVHKKYIGVKSR
ncbi:MAG: hypothetical protein JW795_01905, partial [Chitinivibrionales bacterium]|nr:hypothetical protein [Chitinivibrionales bacterium]